MRFFYNGYDVVNRNKLVITRKNFNFNSDKNYYRELKSVLTIKHSKDLSLVRVGRIGDGGYIMIDNISQGGYSVLVWNF